MIGIQGFKDLLLKLKECMIYNKILDFPHFPLDCSGDEILQMVHIA